MNLFYDSKKKKIRLWVPISFVLVPIILVILFLQIGRIIAEKEQKEQEQNNKGDIFERI